MRKVLFFFIIALFLPLTLQAAEPAKEGIVIDHAWGRPTMGEMRTTALYMTLTNNGKGADVLTGISTPVAENVALHNTVIGEDGVARMLPLDKISVPAGEKIVFEPGHLHVMVMGVKKSLVKGEHIPLQLTFLKAGTKQVDAIIE